MSYYNESVSKPVFMKRFKLFVKSTVLSFKNKHILFIMFKTIKLFGEIEINNNYLIACDIDDTLLMFTEMTRQHWKDYYNLHYAVHHDHDLADQYSYRQWCLHIHANKPQATDQKGFNNMIDEIKLKNCKIIFVTARSSNLKNITKCHFDDVNLVLDDFDSHFIESENKGKFIKNNVNFACFDKMVFIDDAEHNLINVKEEFGDFVECYKFVIE